jgi:hypothetical protein
MTLPILPQPSPPQSPLGCSVARGGGGSCTAAGVVLLVFNALLWRAAPCSRLAGLARGVGGGDPVAVAGAVSCWRLALFFC